MHTLRDHWDAYDFVFLHYKDTDKAGEDGDFPGKVAALERLDAAMPAITALNPDVLVVSGDHATPASPPGPFLAPGARSPWSVSTPCPMPWSASPSGPAGREASGPCRPTTSCRSSWPTPCA